MLFVTAVNTDTDTREGTCWRNKMFSFGLPGSCGEKMCETCWSGTGRFPRSQKSQNNEWLPQRRISRCNYSLRSYESRAVDSKCSSGPQSRNLREVRNQLLHMICDLRNHHELGWHKCSNCGRLKYLLYILTYVYSIIYISLIYLLDSIGGCSVSPSANRSNKSDSRLLTVTYIRLPIVHHLYITT